MSSTAEDDLLKKELLGLFAHLNQMRRELATLHRDDNAKFDSMADTLDAIIENTESAGNTILESMEQIDGLVGQLRKTAGDQDGEVYEKITECIGQVFEACSFQDLTGQRITRVVKSLNFVEKRIGAIVRMWGRDELERVAANLDVDGDAAANEDKKLLHGPQRSNVAISQDDIDKLFS